MIEPPCDSMIVREIDRPTQFYVRLWHKADTGISRVNTRSSEFRAYNELMKVSVRASQMITRDHD